MTTFAEFKDYLMVHLWKQGDSTVLANLNTIIKTAEAELNRDFKVEDRVTVAPITMTSNPFPLPLDYRELRHCFSPHRGEMIYNIPADFADKRAIGDVTGKDFTIVNKQIWTVLDASPVAPLDLEIWYYKNLLPFANIIPPEVNWIVEDYFDVYLYCVLKHTAPFLREDERLQVWGALFSSAIDGAMNENESRKFAGSPLKIKFPSGVR